MNVIEKIMQLGLEVLGLYYGNYRGYVLDNEDPNNMNRIRVMVPSIHGQDFQGVWAYPKNNWGGKDYGLQMLPQKKDVVFIEFQNGNTDYPIWSHAGYALEELPNEFSTTNHYGFKTPKGTLLLINDNEGEEEILVKHNSKTDWYKIQKNEFELESKLIKLGKEGDEQAVLGDTLKSKLDSIMDRLDQTHQALITHTHTSNSGPTGPPINATTFTNIKNALSNIKSQFSEFLSNKVKIDK